MTIKYYFNRIQVMLARIAIISKEVLPSNRSLVNLLNVWPHARFLDMILAGVYGTVQDTPDDGQLFERFKDYIEEEEVRMAKKLHSIMYFIDATNTLNFVTGSGRLEKVCHASSRLTTLTDSRVSICLPSYFFCYIVHGM